MSTRVGGDQTGPTRAPNRRLPATHADNPLRAPISAVLTGARTHISVEHVFDHLKHQDRLTLRTRS
jgi:hypothetical protein